MANQIKKLNTIAIASIEKVNTLTDANIEKLNTLNFAGVVAIATWTAESGNLGTAKYAGSLFGTAADAVYCGGYVSGALNTTEIWDGSSGTGAWSAGSNNLGAASHGGTGAGIRGSGTYDGLKITGSGGASKTCELWNGTDNTWSSAADTNVAHLQGTSAGGGAVDNALVLGGTEGAATKAEHYDLSGDSWTAGSNTTAERNELMGGDSGGAGYAKLIAGADDGYTKLVTCTNYTTASDTWSSSVNYPVATASGASFGQTSADDVVAAAGRTASGSAGVASTNEFNNGAWQTGNNLTRNRRTIQGCGPTGNGITAGGYDGSFRGYTDTMTRTVST